MKSKIITPLLFATLILIGSSIGYFASKTIHPTPTPTPTPTSPLPNYETNPQFGPPKTFISPIRRTANNVVLVQMKGYLQPNTWENGQVNITVADQTYTLLLPEKIKLICQPSKTKQNFNNSFIDLRMVTNFQPNTSPKVVKAFFKQHPQVSLVAEDTGDHHTFRLKLLVGYGCNLAH